MMTRYETDWRSTAEEAKKGKIRWWYSGPSSPQEFQLLLCIVERLEALVTAVDGLSESILKVGSR